MKKKPFPVNFVLDTSFFEQNNFLVGKNFSAIKSLVDEGIISISLTDIIEREILNRFKVNLKKAEESINKPKKNLQDNAKILRNFPEMNTYFNLPEVNYADLENKFLINFSTWKKDLKVSIIKTNHLMIGEVMDDYFNSKLPFKSAIKKHEFPDAFSLKGIISHFNAKREICYFISHDSDFSELNDKYVKTTSDFSSLSDELIRSHATKKKEGLAIELIDEGYKISRLQIQEEISEFLTEYVQDEANLIISVENVQITEVSECQISNLYLNGYQLLELDLEKGKATIKVDVEFSYHVKMIGDDFDGAYYDSDDRVWVDLGEKEFISTGENRVEAYFNFNFELTPKRYYDFEIDSVDFVNKLDIARGLD